MTINRLLAAFAACLLLATAPAFAQEAPAAEVPPTLAEQMAGLEAATVALRGLEALSPIARAFPTRDEVRAYLADLYARELPPDDLARTADFYIALGLLPSDIDLAAVYLDLLGAQVAGFYDTDTQTMNVIPLLTEQAGQRLGLTEQIIYVHEYTHALQDMHFDLDAVLPGDIGLQFPDRALAIISLVEGDATAVMQVYLQEAASSNPMLALTLLAEGALSGTLTLPAGVPDILTRELTFPYEAGLAFVLAIWNEGGWEAVNAAFANPPTTSEQIIHPAKYLAGEGMAEIGATASIDDAAWVQTWQTSLGEFYLREFLLSLGALTGSANRTAAGWGADSYAVWRNGDQRAFSLRLIFDTEADLQEFVDLFDDLTGAFSAYPGGCGQYAEGALCAQQSGAEVIISGAPTEALALRLAGG